MALSIDQFAKAVIAAGLSSADEIKSLWAARPAGTRPKDGKTFSQLLVEREKLTQFQASERSSQAAIKSTWLFRSSVTGE